MVKPLTIYKASAGSGKTFTLATEYIRLVVENPQCYRNILAVTFTNKATEEMKMRILSQLYGIWKQLPESDKYLKVIRKRTRLKEDLIRERAGMALHNLIHNYSDFRVMTIDTFFQGVLRNLARELDLTANLRIGLNDYQVEELAVDEIIQDLKVTDVMLHWLMRYILDNISDDKSWNVIGQIKQFGRTIFKDEYKAVSALIQQKMEEPGFFEAYTEQLKDIRQQAKHNMKGFADQFFDTLESEGLTVDDLLYGKNGIAGFFLKLREGIFDESVIGKRVTDAMEDPSKWYKKSHPQAEMIHTLADTSLCQLLRYAIEAQPKQWKRYKSADLTLRHLTQLRLLGSIEKKVRELNEEANRFLLSDTQQLLHELIDGSDTPFIFEKIGTQLDHVMIDEFQDTSTVQWQNFKVLLSEAMSREQSGSLIVGDVKQSIYRWRSGDWQLLNDIEQQFPHPDEQLDIQTLGTNYRSDRRIIEFNNAFFRQAAELEYLALGDSPEVERLRKAYADVEQQIPEDKPDEGWVDIRLLPQEDYTEQTLRQLVEGVKELQGQGVQSHQIAILVRTNAMIPVIAQYFMQYLPEVSIVSDEAFRLDASSAVCLLIEALRFLTRPKDLLTKATIVKLYQREVLHNEVGDEQFLLDKEAFDRLLPEAYIQHVEELREMPLYELTERLFTIFQIDRVGDQSAYICAFFDQLTAYLQESLDSPNLPTLLRFLSEWDETLCGKTIQSDVISGIRLISIHKSKGLEFDHVFIPFCDWQLEKQGNILWCQPHEAPFDTLPLAPVDYGQKQLLGTIYEADYHHEHLQNVVDNLNLLYVAFTRASKSLHVFGKQNAPSNSRSSLLEQVLNAIQGQDLPSQNIPMSKGQVLSSPNIPHDGVFRGTSGPGARTFGEGSNLTSNPFTISPKPLKINLATYENKVEFRQSNRSRAFIEGEDEQSGTDYLSIGNILHEVLSHIRTTADIAPTIRRFQLEGLLTPSLLSSLNSKLSTLNSETDWFSDKWTLFNECTILSQENGILKERRPDRVMTDGTKWIVVDFKFATPKPEHKTQVREYMTLLHQMHPNQTIMGYLWYVYPNKIIEV
jgi:ATP-dependent exoDNAse (exonuclease V) beta subunit